LLYEDKYSPASFNALTNSLTLSFPEPVILNPIEGKEIPDLPFVFTHSSKSNFPDFI
jgi:hypothetical protein